MEGRHWILGGDFNLITSFEQKKEARRSLEEECELFRDTIEKLKFVDITPGHGSFTWNNKRKGDRHIASLLTRYLVYESVM